jgi:hypothetical protein
MNKPLPKYDRVGLDTCVKHRLIFTVVRSPARTQVHSRYCGDLSAGARREYSVCVPILLPECGTI